MARRRDDLHGARSFGHHQPGFDRVEELDASSREAGEELDDVELRDQRVGDFHERSGE